MGSILNALLQNQQYQQAATVEALSKISAIQELNRKDNLAKQFLSMGDFSPENIQKFAQTSGATQEDMVGLMNLAKQQVEYKNAYDPLTPITTVDEKTGIKYSQMLPQSKVIAMGPTATDVPEPETVFNLESGKATKQSPFSAYGEGVVPESAYSLLKQLTARQQESEADRQNRVAIQSMGDTAATGRNAASIQAQKDIAKMNYEADKAKSGYEATKEAKKEESSRIDSILKNGKEMLVPKGPPIFTLDGNIDEESATAVYDEIKPLVNSPDRGKAAAAQKWIEAFNRKFGVTTDQVKVEDPLELGIFNK